MTETAEGRGSRGRAVRVVALGAALVAATSSGVAGQACSAGVARAGWVGIEGLACNCTVSTSGEVPEWSFRSEPMILGVEEGSRADGVLRAGDEIVAIDGDLITTARAGRAYGALRPGTPMRLTVRREGRLVEVDLTPAPICADDARSQVPTPRAMGGGMRWAVPPERPPEPPAPPSVPRAPGARPAPAPSTPAVPRPAPLPPLAPPAPRLNRHGGWFGFGISCARCGWELEEGDTVPRWEFEDAPRLMGVEQGSPAFEAGLRSGDELLRIDGVSLLTEDGGRRFGAVRPGQRVRWGYRRGAEERTVEVRAIERPVVPERARTPMPESFRTQRFRDFVGNVEVEVLGGPSVVTTIVEAGRDIIIDTGEARIRIRARSDGGEPRRD